jgi:hypothetical protein
VFHRKPTASIAVPLVVVGNAIVLASKDAPHVIATDVVPVISMMNESLSLGVPVRFVVKLVIAAV